MITCTVDYGRGDDVTVMLTDTTFTGGSARIDVCDGVVSYTVRCNNGARSSAIIDTFRQIDLNVLKAEHEIAYSLALNANYADSACNYRVVYARLLASLDTELNLR